MAMLTRSCAGVEGVLYQLLDDRRRAFDDLACRDLIGDLIGQDFDDPHGCRSFLISNRHAAPSPFAPGERSRVFDDGAGEIDSGAALESLQAG